ncbi:MULTISPECIES: Rv3654c family TadE-like protein [Rhodococcus]|uniref:Rv3654c family TadE-like protein n=1 Tax=Rhodococcus TaxID=1827 RepID=UPI001CF8998D|nr:MULTISPECIES: Rv3654c family TadE-like protein [Rhodococcus]
MTRSSATRGDDRGAASIVGCAVMAALTVVAALVVHAGSVVATRHRAQAAADLAALAVAAALDRGAMSACTRADAVAGRMRVRVVRCEIRGWDAVVETAAPTSPVFGGRDATAIARAGPARG